MNCGYTINIQGEVKSKNIIMIVVSNKFDNTINVNAFNDRRK